MANLIRVESACTEDLGPAFRLIFRHIPDAEREVRVANALDLVQRGELDRGGIKVVRGDPGLAGALISAPVAGAGGIIWPPAVAAPQDREAIEDRLVADALHWLQGQGAKLAQCLLSESEVTMGGSLVRNGFARITDLWYTRHALTGIETRDRAETLTLETYAECDRDDFHQTLLRSYEGTRDCPEVNGIRTIEEVIAGHKNQGTHDPELWWLARVRGTPAGVLLLTEMVEWRGWDLIYLGVVPEQRRRGVGRELTEHALRAGRAAGQRQLTLSVDVRNEPAWKLYHSLGFEAYERRTVFLWIADPKCSPHAPREDTSSRGA
jgi:ribosomal protein S18 acetylase RimI-like enzyme